ncbi:MAG: hypothetical protein FJ202_03370 [Gemmatimonadetes bacterium]|nr:hypothetical protein [Gemmatimonadota bacterium]
MTRPQAIAAQCVVLVIASVLAPSGARTQGGRPPSADSVARRDSLATVIVRAVRPRADSSAAATVLGRDQLSATSYGQDAPLALLRTPSLTAYSDAGGPSGYSYLRIRGIDQSRVAITFDGVPLNDPEDQVLYFSNVPDILGSAASVVIGRGASIGAAGTAPYAASLDIRSRSPATTPRGASFRALAGSFGTWQTAVEGATGLSRAGFAALGRFTRQGTDGYREHSGNDAWSWHGSAGWFTPTQALRISGFAGSSGTQLAYLAAAESDLRVNPRANPLSRAEGDRFGQQMVSVQYAAELNNRFRASLQAYRNSAAGAYDVSFGPAEGGGLSLANYSLRHIWTGATAAVERSWPNFAATLGASAYDYHRDHSMAMRPTLTSPEYANTGVKRETAAFGRAMWRAGRAQLTADLAYRAPTFRYRPSQNAGIAPLQAGWSFVSPRAAATVELSRGLTLMLATGTTSREPARGDLFAGADDVNSTNVAGLTPLTRVRPERVWDTEAGLRWAGPSGVLKVNAFAMEFTNEIAPIGTLSVTGLPLRKNVRRSYRRGIEIEGKRHTTLGTVHANGSWLQARLAEFVDDASGVRYTDVAPLLTPRLLLNAEWRGREWRGLVASVAVRRQGASQLANDGNAELRAPAFTIAATSLAFARGAAQWRIWIDNLFGTTAYPSGYTDGTARYFYPAAGRSITVSVRLATLGAR